MSLGGGSGWAILAFDFRTREPAVTWSGNHTQALAFGAPLLVLDMYEHAFHIDYGAAAGKYIDAFWANVSWEAVAGRYDRALHAAAALRG
jgi:Fe-Mn family superoxide dismutase